MRFVVPVFPVIISIGRFKINTILGFSPKCVWFFSPLGGIVVTFKLFMRTIPIIISLTPSNRTYFRVLACYHARGEYHPNPPTYHNRRIKRYHSTFFLKTRSGHFALLDYDGAHTHIWAFKQARPTRFQSDKKSTQNSLIF